MHSGVFRYHSHRGIHQARLLSGSSNPFSSRPWTSYAETRGCLLDCVCLLQSHDPVSGTSLHAAIDARCDWVHGPGAWS